MVRTNTVQGPGAADAGIIRLKGSKKGLVAKTDCNGRYVYLNPRRGGQIAVAESARNVVCSGAKPMAITNCLNYGNPYKPEVYWTFKESLAGMGDACRKLNTPVTGGNVSFYNENPESAIFPTPIIGMLGIIEDVEKHKMSPSFKNEGDIILYVGAPRIGLGGTEYLKVVHGLTTGDAPKLDLDVELKVQQTVLEVITSGLVTAAHDVSDGGLAVCITEMGVFGDLGAQINLSVLSGSIHEVWFSEAQSGIVLTCQPDNYESLIKQLTQGGVEVAQIGTVQGDTLEFEGIGSVNVGHLHSIYEGAIPKAMA